MYKKLLSNFLLLGFLALAFFHVFITFFTKLDTRSAIFKIFVDFELKIWITPRYSIKLSSNDLITI